MSTLEVFQESNTNARVMPRIHHRSRSAGSTSLSEACERIQDEATRENSSGTAASVKATKAEVLDWFRTYWFVLIYSTSFLVLEVLLLYFSFFGASMDDGSTPEFLSCRSWGFGTSCGLWGVDCRPFESDWSAFRCPTRCTLDQSSSLAVYGSGLYRADSRICRAAIHAGAIGRNGGCGFYRFAGAANSFSSSTANGVTSTEYLSWFPKTIEFKAASSEFCTDLSWWILATGAIGTAGLAILPHCRTSFMFYSLVGWGIFYVRLVGQPANENYVGITINTFGEVMILLAVCHLVFRVAVVHTLKGWEAMTLKQRVNLWSICYILPFHLMINLNFFAYVPWLNIDLGGYETIHANAGTYVVLSVALCLAAFAAFSILRNLYRSGLWKRHIVLYTTFIATIVVSWSLFPSTSFHLHHTMLGAFIIPITVSPTKVAAVSQALAVGCFIQGYARWGWHPYMDTIPTYMTIAVPKNPPNSTNVTASQVAVVWESLNSVEAYSLRLNHVEVYRGLETSAVISNLQPNITYFLAVAGVASWGTDGRAGPSSNFTTLNKTEEM